jgi:hypothetical protein
LLIAAATIISDWDFYIKTQREHTTLKRQYAEPLPKQTGAVPRAKVKDLHEQQRTVPSRTYQRLRLPPAVPSPQGHGHSQQRRRELTSLAVRTSKKRMIA